MFCVIQEVQRKKPNEFGHHPEIEVYSFEIMGKRKYCWQYAGERFERPIRTAYKVSIHSSRRVQGVVTKRQYPVTTAGYYDLVEFGLWDCIRPGKVETIAEALDVPEEDLWNLINAKIDPLQARIQKEFSKTPEGKAKEEHDRILREYHRKKEAFSKGWGVDADQYDYCYDVFGKVMNQAYIDAIMKADKQRQQAYGSYQKAYGGNHSAYSQLLGSSGSAYSAEDRARLKQFYKSLSKIYHPDVNLGKDTHEEMVLLNRLKEEWGI